MAILIKYLLESELFAVDAAYTINSAHHNLINVASTHQLLKSRCYTERKTAAHPNSQHGLTVTNTTTRKTRSSSIRSISPIRSTKHSIFVEILGVLYEDENTTPATGWQLSEQPKVISQSHPTPHMLPSKVVTQTAMSKQTHFTVKDGQRARYLTSHCSRCS